MREESKKSFKIYLIKFDITIDYNRKRENMNVSKSTHPSLINLPCLTSWPILAKRRSSLQFEVIGSGQWFVAKF